MTGWVLAGGEQLVAAALADAAGGALHPPAGLPDRLAELLVARVGGWVQG